MDPLTIAAVGSAGAGLWGALNQNGANNNNYQAQLAQLAMQQARQNQITQAVNQFLQPGLNPFAAQLMQMFAGNAGQAGNNAATGNTPGTAPIPVLPPGQNPGVGGYIGNVGASGSLTSAEEAQIRQQYPAEIATAIINGVKGGQSFMMNGVLYGKPTNQSTPNNGPSGGLTDAQKAQRMEGADDPNSPYYGMNVGEYLKQLNTPNSAVWNQMRQTPGAVWQNGAWQMNSASGQYIQQVKTPGSPEFNIYGQNHPEQEWNPSKGDWVLKGTNVSGTGIITGTNGPTQPSNPQQPQTQTPPPPTPTGPGGQGILGDTIYDQNNSTQTGPNGTGETVGGTGPQVTYDPTKTTPTTVGQPPLAGLPGIQGGAGYSIPGMPGFTQPSGTLNIQQYNPLVAQLPPQVMAMLNSPAFANQAQNVFAQMVNPFIGTQNGQAAQAQSMMINPSQINPVQMAGPAQVAPREATAALQNNPLTVQAGQVTPATQAGAPQVQASSVAPSQIAGAPQVAAQQFNGAQMQNTPGVAGMQLNTGLGQTQALNQGQDSLLQLMRSNPLRSMSTQMDAQNNQLNDVQTQGLINTIQNAGNQYDQTGLFGALDAKANTDLQRQLANINGSFGSFGERMGTAALGVKSRAATDAMLGLNAQRQQLGMQAFTDAQNRMMQALGLGGQQVSQNQQNNLAGYQAQGQLAGQLANTGLQQGQMQQQIGLANQGVDMQGQLANQQAGLATNQANAGFQQQAGLQSQQLGAQLGQFNAGNSLAAQQFNAQQALQAQQLNQAAGMQGQLANQAAALQVGGANQQAMNAGQLANLQAFMQAQQANQQAGMQVGAQNQQAQNQFGLANQAALLQADLANQQMGMQTGQVNLGALMQMQQLNQAAQQQAALANQAAFGQTQQFNAGAQNQLLQQGNQYAMQGQIANQQAALQASLANQQAAMQANLANQASQNTVGAQNQGAMLQAQLANMALAGQYGLANQQALNAGQQFNIGNNMTAQQYAAQQQQQWNQFLMGGLTQANSMQQAQSGQNIGLLSLLAGMQTGQAPVAQPSALPGAIGDASQMLMLLPFLRSMGGSSAPAVSQTPYTGGIYGKLPWVP